MQLQSHPLLQDSRMHHIKSGPFILERRCFSPVNSFRGIISLNKLDFENIIFQGAAAGSLQYSGLTRHWVLMPLPVPFILKRKYLNSAHSFRDTVHYNWEILHFRVQLQFFCRFQGGTWSLSLSIYVKTLHPEKELFEPSKAFLRYCFIEYRGKK